MAKQVKKRKKAMTKPTGVPKFETKTSAPKVFGASGDNRSGKNSAAMRSPGSQRKR